MTTTECLIRDEQSGLCRRGTVEIDIDRVLDVYGDEFTPTGTARVAGWGEQYDGECLEYLAPSGAYSVLIQDIFATLS